jgi:hypothetical protein
VFLPDKLNLFLSFFLFAGNTKYLVFFSRPRSKWETKKTKTILVRAFAQKPFRKYATMLTQLKKSTSIKKMTIVHACVSAVAPSARILGAHCAGRVPFLRVGARTGSSVRTPGAASHEIAGRVTTCAGAVGADALRAVPVCRGAGPVWQRLQPVDPLQPASQHVQVGESHVCGWAARPWEKLDVTGVVQAVAGARLGARGLGPCQNSTDTQRQTSACALRSHAGKSSATLAGQGVTTRVESRH